jgi:hypothetical protein
MPAPDPGFVARCRALCPGFEPVAILPARKSELVAGTVGDAHVVAKRLARPDAVWAWYFAREIAIYRAFATTPPPVRVPALVAAADDVLVIERLPGMPLAERRSPQATLGDHVLHELIAMHARMADWRAALPHEPPPPAVRAQLRARFLEDPTAPAEWVRDGIERAARRGLLPAAGAPAMVAALDAYPAVAPSHGDLLLRNAIANGALGLVDWECAGPHLADWDLALLWAQLAAAQRAVVEAAVGTSPARARAFRALAAFALVREIAFLQAYRAPRHANLERLQRELADACARLG